MVAIEGAMRPSNFEQRANGPPRRGRGSDLPAALVLEGKSQVHPCGRAGHGFVLDDNQKHVVGGERTG